MSENNNGGRVQPIENNDNIHMYNLPTTQTNQVDRVETNKGLLDGILNIKVSEVPCFKSSMLYAVGSGMGVLAFTSLIPILRTKKFGPPDFGIWTFLGVASLSWPICDYNHRLHNKRVKLLMDAQVAEMNRKMKEKKDETEK
ncbi:hypothetical protein RB653_008670 [Dictyostelium firmibasis]|uniref:Cytochrome c oxidase assembly protein COX20, mitochondrial n=1 Tax=Dictyostelium firmibasis TaxID=79012 RepID=A0AAN7TSY2_9MYCE